MRGGATNERDPYWAACCCANESSDELPAETVTPIVLFWNKKVFSDVGVQPPTSWEEMLALVPQFNAKKIAPFSLGGQSRWTNMMWLEFLFDRIGGPEVFQAVYDGQKDAWSNPAAMTRAPREASDSAASTMPSSKNWASSIPTTSGGASGSGTSESSSAALPTGTASAFRPSWETTFTSS